MEFDIFDLIIPFIYIPIILGVAYFHQQRYIRQKPYYRFFVRGLVVKIFGDWPLLWFINIITVAEIHLPITKGLR